MLYLIELALYCVFLVCLALHSMQSYDMKFILKICSILFGLLYGIFNYFIFNNVSLNMALRNNKLPEIRGFQVVSSIWSGFGLATVFFALALFISGWPGAAVFFIFGACILVVGILMYTVLIAINKSKLIIANFLRLFVALAMALALFFYHIV